MSGESSKEKKGTVQRSQTSQAIHASQVQQYGVQMSDAMRHGGSGYGHQVIQAMYGYSSYPAVQQKENEAKEKQTASAKTTLLQKKLSIGSPDDSYEKEADAVADQVMQMPEPAVQRKCAHCEAEEGKVQLKPFATSITPVIQAKNTEDDMASESFSQQIESSKGSGSPMADHTRDFMEKRFGADFSSVNVHTGPQAIQLSRQLNAQAFTTGNDIYFNQGKYAPESSQGKQLLAHELTHTIQQTGKTAIQRDKETTAPAAAPVLLPSFDDIKSRILTSYDNLFDKQIEAIDWFAHDMEEADEPSFTQQMIQAAIEAALGKAISAIGTKIGAAIEKTVITTILKEEAKGFDLNNKEQVEFLKKYIEAEQATKSHALTISASLVAAASDKTKGLVKPALDSKPSLPPHKKFIEAQRATLSDAKNELQNIFTFQVTPQLNKLPSEEGLGASMKMFKGIQQSISSADEVQYVHTISEWANLITSQGTGLNNTGGQISGPMAGTLYITYETAGNDFKITDTRFRGMKASILKRLTSTPALKSMKLWDLNCTKVFNGPALMVKHPNGGLNKDDVRSGHSWLMSRPADGTQGDVFGEAIEVWVALENKTIGDLGEISNKRPATFFGKDALFD